MVKPYLLPRMLYEQMESYSLAAAPLEACGLVGGPDTTRASRFFLLTNLEASPTSYLMDGKEVLEVLQALDQNGLIVSAIFHSHPTTAARPSQRDINEAHVSVLYLIMSLSADKPELRGYDICNGDVQEVPVHIIETGGETNVK